MKDQEITVFYKWTARPGKFEELKAIYTNVLEEMKTKEPEATQNGMLLRQ